MSTRETHRNLGDIFRAAAALESDKPGVPVIMPWRMNTNQEHLHNGLDDCGCAFCPDDDGRETT
jgi:hypothetical protein